MIKFKNILSINCPDATIMQLFMNKLKKLGYKFGTSNKYHMGKWTHLWLNEPYESHDEIDHTYGNGMGRLAAGELGISECGDDNIDHLVTHLVLPEDFYKALDLATEIIPRKTLVEKWSPVIAGTQRTPTRKARAWHSGKKPRQPTSIRAKKPSIRVKRSSK